MTLDQTQIKSFNNARAKWHYAFLLSLVLKILVLATAAATLWIIAKPGAMQETIYVFGVTLVLCSYFLKPWQKLQPANDQDISLYLQIKSSHKTQKATPIQLLDESTKEVRQFEKARILQHLSSCLIPLFICILGFGALRPVLAVTWAKINNAILHLQSNTTLTVLNGYYTEKEPLDTKDANKPTFELSTGSPPKISLLSQNLIEVQLTDVVSNASPTIILKKPSKTEKDTNDNKKTPPRVLQSFQMLPSYQAKSLEKDDQNHSSDAPRIPIYKIAFSANEPMEVYIPHISETKPVAILDVKQLPLPQITLQRLPPFDDPISDDETLQVQIKVEAKNPLSKINLLIRSAQRTSTEAVSNILTNDKYELDLTYGLLLEPYLEQDQTELEIVAEAIDQATPVPLVGYSAPLRIRVISSYGRYKQTLATIREMKGIIDQVLAEQNNKIDSKIVELAETTIKQAESSPFFDGLDRINIQSFADAAQSLQEHFNADAAFDLSSKINQFLFEHETLDNRERDRDFFVAARALSRLIEQDKGKRPTKISSVTKRIMDYLKDRENYWKARIQYLQEMGAKDLPEHLKQVQHRNYFQDDIQKINALEEGKLSAAEKRSAQQETLTKAVEDYRQWIEELEKHEDAARREMEKERQQGLASAQQTLRELQRRQDRISKGLDYADGKNKDALRNEWHSLRMEQNTNTRDTKRLENQLRSLAPNANQRMLAALKSMEAVIESGNSNEFSSAESFSDQASRLLRQAQRDTQKEQSRSQRDRGRRKRITSDNYYGSAVISGDIEISHDYEVDKRYREDILDDLQQTPVEEDERSLLDTYLRKLIR